MNMLVSLNSTVSQKLDQRFRKSQVSQLRFSANPSKRPDKDVFNPLKKAFWDDFKHPFFLVPMFTLALAAISQVVSIHKTVPKAFQQEAQRRADQMHHVQKKPDQGSQLVQKELEP